MNFALAAATLAIVIPAELPDKTFISAIIMSSRYSALPVWIGTAGALVLQAGVAVLAGRLLEFLPHRVVDVVVGVLFFSGAAYLFFVAGRHAREEGEKIAEKEASELPDRTTDLRVIATTFGIVALAEFGDLTQIVIANIAARSRDGLSVFIGASVAFIAVSAVGVAAGRTITRYVPFSTVRTISALALAALGIWSFVSAL